MQTSPVQSNSPSWVIKQRFSKTIRKGQIQKYQKQRRQQQMKTSHPILYIQIAKRIITEECIALEDLKQIIQLLAENITNQEFADKVQTQQIIELIVLKAVEVMGNDNSQDKSFKMTEENKEYLSPVKCIFPKKCQCFDCSDNSTSISETFQIKKTAENAQTEKFQMYYENQFQFQQGKSEKQTFFTLLIDFLSQTFEHYLPNKKARSRRSKQNVYTCSLNELTKFRTVFYNIPQILQGVFLDLVNYNKQFYNKENIQNAIQSLQSTQKVSLLLKIVNLLARIGQICWFDQVHWTILIQMYKRYFEKDFTKTKYEQYEVHQINNLFKLTYKSYVLRQVLVNSKNIRNLNKLIYGCLKNINQNLKNQANGQSIDLLRLDQLVDEELNFLLKILGDLKFIQKNVNDQLKQILGELLNIYKRLEGEQFGLQGEISFFFLSPKIVEIQESEISKKCKGLAQKLIQILYVQMELNEDDLHKICVVQPSLKLKIQQTIDADMY